MGIVAVKNVCALTHFDAILLNCVHFPAKVEQTHKCLLVTIARFIANERNEHRLVKTTHTHKHTHEM